MANDLEAIRNLLGALNDAGILIGVLVAAILYSKTQFESSYEKLNDRFLDFLALQIANPGLGTNATDRDIVSLEREPKAAATRDLLFDFLCSLLERSYLFLNTGVDRFFPWKAREWKTWESWIVEYAKNKNFRAYWQRVSHNACYSEQFTSHLNAVLSARETQI